MEKIASNGPKWGRELFFPTNPDLANILGRTVFDFEIFYFCDFLDLKFPRFLNSRAQVLALGSKKKQKIQILKIKIRVAQNVGKVWISRKKQLPASFGAISG